MATKSKSLTEQLKEKRATITQLRQQIARHEHENLLLTKEIDELRKNNLWWSNLYISSLHTDIATHHIQYEYPQEAILELFKKDASYIHGFFSTS